MFFFCDTFYDSVGVCIYDGGSVYDVVGVCAYDGGFIVCLFGFLTSSSTTRLYRGRAPRQERLTILRAATHETELGDHDFCLSRSHYTDTDPTCRERAATTGIEPGTSSPGVARSTAELPRPYDGGSSYDVVGGCGFFLYFIHLQKFSLS